MGHKFDPSHMNRLESSEREAAERPGEWVNQLGIRPGMTVLEIGVGVGFYTPYLRRPAEPGGRVIGTDINATMLKRARERLGPATPVLWVQTEESALPFPEGVFDRAILAHVIHELDHPIVALREVRRVLKPSGRLWIWDWSPDGDPESGPPIGHRVPVRRAKAWARAAGFAVQAVPSPLKDRYFLAAAPG